jgi:hypothetical protein
VSPCRADIGIPISPFPEPCAVDWSSGRICTSRARQAVATPAARALARVGGATTSTPLLCKWFTTQCNAVQLTAIQCNTLQPNTAHAVTPAHHLATPCSTLQQGTARPASWTHSAVAPTMSRHAARALDTNRNRDNTHNDSNILAARCRCCNGDRSTGRGCPKPQSQALANAPFPTFFPPAIWHRPAHGEEVRINQVGACITYAALPPARGSQLADE